MTEDKRICANCVQEPYLRTKISGSEEDGEACDYCDQVAPTISISEVADDCDEVIGAYFTLSSDTAAVIYHDRTPEGMSLREILDEWLTQGDSTATDDVAELLEDRWSNADEGRYGDDPWFIRQSSSWELSNDWADMERSLRDEARLVNPKVIQTFEKVFGGLAAYRTEDGTGVVLEVGPGRSIHTLYRARVFEDHDTLKQALHDPERQLGPPAPMIAGSGRMNARGVSVFYGALERHTALHEVRPPVGASVAIAGFRVLRPLRLLNLPALNAARVDSSLSLFDPATRPIVQRCDFINALEAHLIKPVLPSFTDRGYLTTQAIADYLATHQELNLDGILFRSVQMSQRPDEPCGHNVILFHKAAAVKHADVSKTYANLSHQVDDNDWEEACIVSVPRERNERWPTPFSWKGMREDSLELLRDSIEIHHVDSIVVLASVEKVQHKVAPPEEPRD